MFGEQQSTWIRTLQMAEQAKKNPHDDDLESVLKRATSLLKNSNTFFHSSRTLGKIGGKLF